MNKISTETKLVDRITYAEQRRQLMKDLFAFQDHLALKAVWTLAEEHQSEEKLDLLLRMTGPSTYERRIYPRFIAVLDSGTFQQTQQEAEALRARMKDMEISTRWVPSFFPEVWTHATVRVRQAAQSYRGKGGQDRQGPMELFGKALSKEEWKEQRKQKLQGLREVASRLKAAGLPIIDFWVEGLEDARGLTVTPVLYLELSAPITVRRSSGRSFRLYGVATSGQQHKDVKIGIVVLQGLQGAVHLNLPRKPRADTMRPVATELGYDFFL